MIHLKAAVRINLLFFLHNEAHHIGLCKSTVHRYVVYSHTACRKGYIETQTQCKILGAAEGHVHSQREPAPS